MPVTQLLIPGPFCPIVTPWRPLTREYPSGMCAAPCSCTTGISRIPAGAKISIASMNAEPVMPDTFGHVVGNHGFYKGFTGVMRAIDLLLSVGVVLLMGHLCIS